MFLLQAQQWPTHIRVMTHAIHVTGNLDNTNSREMHELFLQLKKDFNQTFVIVTHNEELAEMSDKRYFMVDGRIDAVS